MRCPVQWLLVGLLFCGPAAAQQAEPPDAGSARSAPAPAYRSTTLSAVVVYLHRADGRWSASLDGDVKDPATEKVEVALADGAVRALAPPLPHGATLCLTKMKDRAQFGYLECNSAFYSAKLAGAAVGTLVRGVMSLGILTISDAASGSTGFTVALNQQALDAAVAESKAVEFARESAPLVEYREAFARASTSKDLRTFIATYENAFDPESLVTQAKAKLPAAIEQERLREEQKAAEAARLAELKRQAQANRLAQLEALKQFQAHLRLGDRVKITKERYLSFYGMIVELKPPLAYVQWENVNPPMQWVRVEDLLPP
jgi:hypothetical protein